MRICQAYVGEKRNHLYPAITKWQKKRLQSLEKKFEGFPEVRERYAKSIQDDTEKGYVKILSEEEVQCDSKVTWYLPHRFSLTPRNLSVSEEYTMHRQSSWDKV